MRLFNRPAGLLCCAIAGMTMEIIAKPYSIDERDVAHYPLPELLTAADGTPVTTAMAWRIGRRAEVLDTLAQGCYGAPLPRPEQMEVQTLSVRTDALGGLATRRELEVTMRRPDGRSRSFVMLVYLPNAASGNVPVFLGLNFKGNHHTTDETDVRPTGGAYTEPGHGLQTHRWCFSEVIRWGYAAATVCYHDIHPDRADGGADSVFALFYTPEELPAVGKKHSVIGAWAWGLSRAREALATLPQIDPNRVIVHGHSRLGKTALWAGATDEKFAMVISNDSGCGGAALHRRKFGENLSQHFEAHLRRGLPIWFVDRLGQFINREETLPFDAHWLLALIAPRPLCVGSADEDLNADPKGEFLACKEASPVYELFGFPPFAAARMPASGECVRGIVNYHLRSGKHDQTPEDWAVYLDAADAYFFPKKSDSQTKQGGAK